MEKLNADCRPSRAMGRGDLRQAGTRDLQLPALGECLDVLLGLRFVERVLGLNFGDQIVFALQGGDLRVGERPALMIIWGGFAFC